MFQQLRRHVVALMLVRNELTCEICVDIITDIDEWLTSDKQGKVSAVANSWWVVGRAAPTLRGERGSFLSVNEKLTCDL